MLVEEGPLGAADGVMWVIVRGTPTAPGVDCTAGVSPLPWGQGGDMRTGIESVQSCFLSWSLVHL